MSSTSRSSSRCSSASTRSRSSPPSRRSPTARRSAAPSTSKAATSSSPAVTVSTGICNVKFDVDPAADPFVFEDEVVGGTVPREYIPSVEKGLKKAVEEGVPPLWVPFVNVRATLHFGKSPRVDSSDLAFQLAGREAFKEAVRRSKVVLLEPRMKFEVTCPEEFTGDVVGDLG